MVQQKKRDDIYSQLESAINWGATTSGADEELLITAFPQITDAKRKLQNLPKSANPDYFNLAYKLLQTYELIKASLSSPPGVLNIALEELWRTFNNDLFTLAQSYYYEDSIPKEPAVLEIASLFQNVMGFKDSPIRNLLIEELQSGADWQRTRKHRSRDIVLKALQTPVATIGE
jgi:hypothetical protein